MKKKITTAMVIAAMSMSIIACGSNTSETQAPTTEAPATTEAPETEAITTTEETEAAATLDLDKCISDLKENLPLEPDYTFVQDYYIGEKDGTITITAVVDDATDPALALDFADTLVRQLNLYAQMQDSSIASASKDFYGGLYERYNALVGVAPASKSDGDTDDWFVFDGIVGGKVMLKLNKQYR